MEYYSDSCPEDIKKYEGLIPKHSGGVFDCGQWVRLFLAIVKDDPDITFKPDEETGEYQEPCCFCQTEGVVNAIWCLMESVYRHTLDDIRDKLKKNILEEIESITEYDYDKLS